MSELFHQRPAAGCEGIKWSVLGHRCYQSLLKKVRFDRLLTFLFPALKEFHVGGFLAGFALLLKGIVGEQDEGFEFIQGDGFPGENPPLEVFRREGGG